MNLAAHHRVVCCRCDGAGGEDAANFGDHGWHPCYHCHTTGTCTCTPDATYHHGTAVTA